MDTKNPMNELSINGAGVELGISDVSETGFSLRAMVQDALRRPTEQREAALGLIYEFIENTFCNDPLRRLQAHLDYKQQVTTALAADLSALSLHETKEATQRIALGKDVKLSKDACRTINSLMHVMDCSTKFSVAQVKVADEITRRTRIRSDR